MGGYGSGGRNYKGRPTVGQCLSLSIKALQRSNALVTGTDGVLTWGKHSIGFETRWEDMIVLKWKVGKDSPEHEQFLGFQWQAHERHFGGHEFYFLCPHCHSRRSTLYFFVNRFSCRCCHKLPYRSQREQEGDRLRSKIEKLAHRLDWEYEWGDLEPPPRPKGMRTHIYEQHRHVYIRSLRRMYDLESLQIERIFKRAP